MSIGFLALLDDISILLDDAAVMTKVSMQKTAGLLGDDLAVNAEKASGFSTKRELPVIWKITKGALLNKIIILPVAFLLSAYLPGIIPYILLLGGCYLAFEGSEKIIEVVETKILKKTHHTHEIILTEKEKVKSAVLTDFILSIEIIVLTLATVMTATLLQQILVVSVIALVATFGVYGSVAMLVRLDDMGLYFIEKHTENTFGNIFGKFLVASLPIIIKILGVVGTWAMLLVSGGIFQHNIPFFHHLYEKVLFFPEFIFQTMLGFIIGLLLAGLFFIGKSIVKK